jgi:glutaconate CoA-transferase subunit A
VWIGVRRELLLAAHAARATLVSVERIQDESLLADERMAAGTIPALYVSALAQVSEGAWPVGLADCYEPDRAHLREYVELAASAEGFQTWMTRHVYREHAA